MSHSNAAVSEATVALDSPDSTDPEVAWLIPFSERWVIRYFLLAVCGMPVIVSGMVMRVGWLEVLGYLLSGPFLLWATIFLTLGYGYLALVVLPTAIWRHFKRNRLDD
jgi:hypothetical protein